MEAPFLTPRSWLDLVWLTVAALLGYGGSHLPSLFKRKQTAAETAKIEAETRSIDLASTIHAGDVLVKLMAEVARTGEINERLRKERDFWRGQAEKLKAEKDLIENQLDEHIRIGDGS